MAEESDSKKQNTSKMPMKTVLVLVGVLLIEGLAISAAFLIAGKPAGVHADQDMIDQEAKMEESVEELVVADKFQNARTGRTFLYDTEVYILIKRKHQENVVSKLDEMKARLTTEISTIFRQAEPKYLDEPTLATVTRQIKAALDEMLGRDIEAGKPIVQKVLIRKCTKYRADF